MLGQLAEMAENEHTRRNRDGAVGPEAVGSFA
jgi:hypothetical protein